MIIKTQAKYIPNGTRVRKPNSSNEYILQNKLAVFNESMYPVPEIDSTGIPVKFLINLSSGNIAVISDDRIIEIDITEDSEFYLLQRIFQMEVNDE